MVAGTSIAERFTRPPQPFVAGRWWVPKLARADAELMMRAGIIPEDASTELLDGLIVLKDRAAFGQDSRMIGKDHAKCVERLSDLRLHINAPGRHVRTQQPLVCSETHVPEPDFSILRGSLDEYDDHPKAADAWCVVEVADSSYERDVGEKLEGYARAGVEQYVVVNLRNRTAEVYASPDVARGSYAPAQVVGERDTLPLRVGEDTFLPVPLADVLP